MMEEWKNGIMFVRLAICENSETNCHSRTIPIAKRIGGRMEYSGIVYLKKTIFQHSNIPVFQSFSIPTEHNKLKKK
jgi:hypothetical protein